MVSENGIEPDPQKIEKVRDYPTPKNLKTLQQFLGLASYYQRYIPLFSKIAAPLHALTRKTAAYVWTPLCQQAFDKLKELLTTSPVLAFPNFSQPFLLETDASGKGVGAVLSQRQEDCSIRPIAYASRTLQKHEANYGISELEALAVVWAVKHFRVYLYGHHCTVFTDHSALKSLLNTPHPYGRLARWGLALQEMDLDIQYRPGKQNTNADTLSRMPPTNIQEEQAIPYVLFAYRTSMQESTKESPFYLLHGRDPRLPTDTALNTPRTCYQVDLDDYKTDLVTNLTEAWQLARQNIKQAQRKQKQQYDRHSKIPKFRVGERVFVYMPNAKQGKNWKFAKPFHGPFRILALTHTNASVRRVDKPQEHPIFVSLDRVRHSPEELPSGETWFGETWFGTTKKRRRNRRQRPPVVETGSSRQVHSPGVWSSCLRPRRGCLSSSQGEM